MIFAVHAQRSNQRNKVYNQANFIYLLDKSFIINQLLPTSVIIFGKYKLCTFTASISPKVEKFSARVTEKQKYMGQTHILSFD